MGFLSDIGRSNAGAAGQSIFGDIMKYKQMDRQDERDALAGFQAARQMEIQNKGLEIQEAKERREQAEFYAKDKERSRRLPLTLRWGPIESWSGSKKAIVEEGRKMGLVEDVGGVPTASAKDYEMFIKTLDPAKAEEMSAMALAEHAADMGEIQRKLAAKPGDEKLIAERDKIIGLYTKQKESHDALVDALAAKKKAEGADKEAIAERRIEETERANLAREEAANRRLDIMEKRVDQSSAGESKEEKRKVKALTEARKEVEKSYGYSQFLPTAQDPLLIEKVAKGKMLVEDIIDNWKDHGLSKEPTPGKAAEMAKRSIDKLYNPAPAAIPEADKKSQSIRELLFGPKGKK
jgi:hypothetical protein